MRPASTLLRTGLLLLLAGCASAPPAPATVLARTEEDLEGLSDAERCDRLRAGLASEDPAASLLAATELEPLFLSLEEIHRQMRILLARAPEVFSWAGAEDGVRWCPGMDSLGSPEVLPFYGAALDHPARPAPGEEPDFRGLRGVTPHDLHRRTLQDHIPGLAPMLDRAEGDLFQDLLWTFFLLANNTDRHREVVQAALDRLAPRLPAEDDSPRGKFRIPEDWFARAWRRLAAEAPPSPLEAYAPSAAVARIEVLAGEPLPEDEAWDRFEDETPLLEVAAPEALDALLARWEDAAVEGWTETIRDLRARRARVPDPAAEARKIRDALARGEAPGPSLARLGLLGEEARPVLEKYRRERHHGLYWPATAGLAIAGDAAARAEVLAFLAEDRIAVFDAQWDDLGFTLNGDPEALEHWRSRVGANCCLWFKAWRAIRRWYPTMPAENRAGDPDGLEERSRLWWERWKDRLAWSRIADGWVPVDR